MHALITGAGGFIGSTMVRAFRAAGWQVSAAGRGDALPARFDYLVHCAAEVPAKCPDETALYRGNVEGTQRVLEGAEAAGARRVTFLSSMAAYGTIGVPVVDEATPANLPDNYGRSKAESERLLAQWCAQEGRAGVSIRLPGVVGAGGRNNFVCDALLRILAREPVHARNPDALFNNIVHVSDLAAFVLKLASAMPTGHSLLTVAAAEPLQIREVLARLFRKTGRTENIVWEQGGGRPFLIEFGRARALGYRPATVADSLDRFVTDVADASR
jgi:nucleoside-diphosphate-sugar epimerase